MIEITKEQKELMKLMLKDTDFKQDYLATEGNLDAVYSEDEATAFLAAMVYYGWLIARYGQVWKKAIEFPEL